MTQGEGAAGVDSPTAAVEAVSDSPTRTCVGCRKRESKANLVRVIAVSGTCVPDPQARMPGRGAYLHLRAECLEQAQRSRSVARALRVQAPLDLGKVFDLLNQE